MPLSTPPAGSCAPRLREAAWGLVVLAAALLTLALPSPSHAAAGDLVFRGCIALGGLSGCTPVGSLEGATGVAVSPDGASVYVTSLTNDSITTFSRGAGGALAFQGCIAEGGLAGCTAAPSLDGAVGAAVSPDGASVYVASLEDDSVTIFSRGAAGALAFQGCYAEGGGSGCTAAAWLDGASGVAVAPDGTSVYVTSGFDDTITTFSRGAAGALAFSGCFDEGGASGCQPTGSLDGAYGVAVSPDGASVYVTSLFDDSITHFSRSAAGDLAVQGCIAEGGASGCTPAASLSATQGVALSPDGASVYVASLVDDAITTFARGTEGALALQGCIAEGGASLCTPAASLDGATDVAVSPDGASVYVASATDDSITAFARGAAGDLALRGCIAEGGTSGCTPVGSLDGATDVAVSPDGASVYVASFADHSISHFARELPPAPAGATAPAGPPASAGPAPPAPRCAGRRATIVARGRLTRGTRRADVIVGRPGRDRIRGLGGADVICGRAGADRLEGGAGPDLLIGGAGGDALLGGLGVDVIRGGAGRDRLTGGAGRDRLLGGPGFDRELQ